MNRELRVKCELQDLHNTRTEGPISSYTRLIVYSDSE